MEPTFRSTEQNADVTRTTEFAGTIDFSDRNAHQLKTYDLVDNIVSVLLGSGREGQLDGTQQSCTFNLFRCRAFARLRRLFLLLMLLLAKSRLRKVSLELGKF